VRKKYSRFARWSIAAFLVLGLGTRSYGRAALADQNGQGDQGSHIGEHTFHGRYIAAYNGFDAIPASNTTEEPNPPAIPYAVSGALWSDGKGTVIGFENGNYGTPGTGDAATCTLKGTYSVSSLSNGMQGLVTLNLTSSCAAVTCTGTTTPSCSTGSFSPGPSTQWLCALSGPSGKQLVCTVMGETTSGTAQTLIGSLTWRRSND